MGYRPIMGAAALFGAALAVVLLDCRCGGHGDALGQQPSLTRLGVMVQQG